MILNFGRKLCREYIKKLCKQSFETEECLRRENIFTGDGEQLALYEFRKYEGACGRVLMRLRLDKKGFKYVG